METILNQSINEVYSSLNLLHSCTWPINQSINQSVSQSVSQSIKIARRSLNQSSWHSCNGSINQTINQLSHWHASASFRQLTYPWRGSLSWGQYYERLSCSTRIVSWGTCLPTLLLDFCRPVSPRFYQDTQGQYDFLASSSCAHLRILLPSHCCVGIQQAAALKTMIQNYSLIEKDYRVNWLEPWEGLLFVTDVSTTCVEATFTGLWRWLPHRLSKRQSQTTALLRTCYERYLSSTGRKTWNVKAWTEIRNHSKCFFSLQPQYLYLGNL